jgi:excinuclease ABC subunit B
VILYADRITGSMARAMMETDRRRAKQEEYNLEHGITPTTIKRNIGDVLADVSMKDGLVVDTGDDETQHLVGHNLKAYIADLEEQMKKAASDLEFETAAAIRDQIRRLEMDELGLPPDARAAAAKGRATGGVAGTRTTRFSKMQKKGFSAKRRGAGR